MRQPTPARVLYAWHTKAMAGDRSLVITDDAQCGWFKRKLVKDGPWVAARIWMHQPIDPETGELEGDEFLLCEVAGKPRDAGDQWTWLASNPISKADYEFMLADARWAKTNAPTDPIANPDQPVNFLKSPLPF